MMMLKEQAFLFRKYVYQDDGTFKWVKLTGRASNPAGSKVGNGRWYVEGYGGRRELNRMVWLYHHGWLPPTGYVVDHIDRDVLNNRISNLRVITASDNNIKAGGVDKAKGQWRARLRQKHIGLYPTRELAQEARDSALAASPIKTYTYEELYLHFAILDAK